MQSHGLFSLITVSILDFAPDQEDTTKTLACYHDQAFTGAHASGRIDTGLDALCRTPPVLSQVMLMALRWRSDKVNPLHSQHASSCCNVSCRVNGH